ncbi:MAG: hypothetical protein JNJ83_23940 [Verrucomicrobiaceae bacterium]|nr:hypothetical protein [Verrucomicrobiaceae bacterium]
MQLPTRPSTYLLGLLLIVFGALVFWLNRTVDNPALQSAIEESKKKTANASPSTSMGSGPSGFVPPQARPIDPANQAIADQMFDPEQPPTRDLEIVDHFVEVLRRATGANPIGDNADITYALTGGGEPNRPRVFPPAHKAVKGGQLVDRWGTPFWFHPNSGTQMEIRSAGPDKEMFTVDDVILNPSPAGLGATPQGNQPPR